MIQPHPFGVEDTSIVLRLPPLGRLPRVVTVPFAGLALALVSCVGVLLLQKHEEDSRRAQLTLAEIKNDLVVLQGLPWQVQNPNWGTPQQIRAQMMQTEHGIELRLDRLLRSSPPASLADAKEALQTNFEALEPVFKMGVQPDGWNDPAVATLIGQRQTATVVDAYGRLDHAGSVYAHRAGVAEWISRIGMVGTIVVLLAGFLFYFRRAEKIRSELSAEARTDPLTRLANRGAFTEALEERLATEPAAVLFLDLDGFKDVNDAFGHRGGDVILREVAARLERDARDEDLCARFGGDEFAVAIRHGDAAVAEALADRIAAALAQPVVVAGKAAHIGASIGVATGPAGTDVDVLVHQSDLAMYAAKAAGGGTMRVFEPGMPDRRRPHAAARQLAGRRGGEQLGSEPA